MHLRLTLLALLVKRFMLLDTGLPPDGSEPMTRMERERAEIPLLLARAIVNMHECDWAPAETLDLWTGERRVGRRWYNLGRLEHIYEPMHVVAMSLDLYLRSDGLVFHRTIASSPSGRAHFGPVRLVSRPAEIESWQVSALHTGLCELANYAPART